MFQRPRLTALAALLLASCHSAAPTIKVRDAWARETAPGQSSGAAYVTIANPGSRDDRLIGITTPSAANAMLHSSRDSGGVMAMRMAVDVTIPGGATVSLAPLGTHIMLTGLVAPLKVGERIPLTLRFAHAGERHADALVVAAGSNGLGR